MFKLKIFGNSNLAEFKYTVSYTFLCLNFTSFLKMQKYVECSIRSALKCGHFDTKPPV